MIIDRNLRISEAEVSQCVIGRFEIDCGCSCQIAISLAHDPEIIAPKPQATVTDSDHTTLIGIVNQGLAPEL